MMVNNGWVWVKRALGIAAVWALPRVVSRIVDQLLNRVEATAVDKTGQEGGETAVALHKQIFVADFHADSLLWRRDLDRSYSYGHTGIPRWQAGNVALQVIGVATQVPLGINFQHNQAGFDLLFPLTLVQGWPHRTWTSPFQRALYQAERLYKLQAAAPAELQLIRTKADLLNLRRHRQAGDKVIGTLLALEGAHTLAGSLARWQQLYQAGFRMLGLTHFIDNEAGGSAHGRQKGGITPFGRDLVQVAQAHNTLIDLAHASPRLIDDVLALTAAPVIVSHTGLQGTHHSPRNISDDHLRAVAETGGVVGIAFFAEAVGETSVAAIVRALSYGAELVGVDHMALGSDFDGAVTVPVDAGRLPAITAALLAHGFTEAEIAKMMGLNIVRVLAATLPTS